MAAAPATILLRQLARKPAPSSDVKTGAAAAAPSDGGPRSDMALAVSASSEDVDVANSAEVLGDWSSLSDLRLIDSDIISKGDLPAAEAAPSPEAPAVDKVDKPAELPSRPIGCGRPRPIDPTDDDMILFLCPSGHKLHGLKRLAGKVGQCPHCNAKFEIPFPYDTDDEEWGRDGLDDTVTEDPLSDFGEELPGEARGRPAAGFRRTAARAAARKRYALEARAVRRRPRNRQQYSGPHHRAVGQEQSAERRGAGPCPSTTSPRTGACRNACFTAAFKARTHGPSAGRARDATVERARPRRSDRAASAGRRAAWPLIGSTRTIRRIRTACLHRRRPTAQWP